MQCEACKEEVHPVQEMLANGAGFTNRCPRLECGAPMPRIEPRNIVGDDLQQEIELRRDAQAIAKPIAKVLVPGDSAPTWAHLLTPPADMVSVIRERLEVVEGQLANVEKLQAEARRLRAMIAAVEALDAN